jgi:hypothetical protein
VTTFLSTSSYFLPFWQGSVQISPPHSSHTLFINEFPHFFHTFPFFSLHMLSSPLFLAYPHLSVSFSPVYLHPLLLPIHCKKELAVFPSPAGMSLIKLFLGGNNLVFSRPERVWSVTSRLGTGKWLTLFYSVLSISSLCTVCTVCIHFSFCLLSSSYFCLYSSVSLFSSASILLFRFLRLFPSLCLFLRFSPSLCHSFLVSFRPSPSLSCISLSFVSLSSSVVIFPF